MKCAVCEEEHDVVYLHAACHPNAALHIAASTHPESGEFILEMQCAKCGKFVALFTARQVPVAHGYKG